GVLLSSSGHFPGDKAALQRSDLLRRRTPRTINMATIGNDLLREASPALGAKLVALVVYNIIPVAIAPDCAQVAAGFARDDLVPGFDEDDASLCVTAYGNKVDFGELLDQGFTTLHLPDAPFAEGGFPTPSGKCEFFSERVARLGLDGLPDHLGNYEAPGTSERYPLAMISPPHRNFPSSTFVNVPT